MMTARKACGSRIIRRFCPKVKPSERAASAWPSGTVLHAEREWSRRRTTRCRAVRPSTASRKLLSSIDVGEFCVDQRDAQRLGQPERAEQHDQRQRGVAHHVDVGRADPVEHRHRRKPHRGQHRAEDERTDTRVDGQLDGHPERREESRAVALDRSRPPRTVTRARRLVSTGRRAAVSGAGIPAGAEVLVPRGLPGAVGFHLLQRVVDLGAQLGVTLLQADAVLLVGERLADDLELARVSARRSRRGSPRRW